MTQRLTFTFQFFSFDIFKAFHLKLFWSFTYFWTKHQNNIFKLFVKYHFKKSLPYLWLNVLRYYMIRITFLWRFSHYTFYLNAGEHFVKRFAFFVTQHLTWLKRFRVQSLHIFIKAGVGNFIETIMHTSSQLHGIQECDLIVKPKASSSSLRDFYFWTQN